MLLAFIDKINEMKEMGNITFIIYANINILVIIDRNYEVCKNEGIRMSNKKLAIAVAKFIVNHHNLQDVDPLTAEIEARKSDLFDDDYDCYLLFNNQEVFLGFEHSVKDIYPKFFMEDETGLKSKKELRDVKFISKVINSFKP